MAFIFEILAKTSNTSGTYLTLVSQCPPASSTIPVLAFREAELHYTTLRLLSDGDATHIGSHARSPQYGARETMVARVVKVETSSAGHGKDSICYAFDPGRGS